MSDLERVVLVSKFMIEIGSFGMEFNGTVLAKPEKGNLYMLDSIL